MISVLARRDCERCIAVDSVSHTPRFLGDCMTLCIAIVSSSGLLPYYALLLIVWFLRAIGRNAAYSVHFGVQDNHVPL